MKTHRGNLNAYYLVKEANLEMLHGMWFQPYYILWKAKLWRQYQPLLQSEGNEQAEHRGVLGHWKYFAWQYNDRYMSLYFCPSP